MERCIQQISSRCKWLATSKRVSRSGFFVSAETLPTGADGDVYIMRQICHNWTDDTVVCILTSIRAAMKTAKARLAIVEVAPILLLAPTSISGQLSQPHHTNVPSLIYQSGPNADCGKMSPDAI